MKRMMAAVVLLVGAAAFADPYQTGRINEIQVYNNGSVHVSLVNNPALCSGSSLTFASIYPANPVERDKETVRNQLATLTAAKLAGRPVILATSYDSVSAKCILQHVVLP